MSPNLDSVFLGQPDCFEHDGRISSMETACDIGVVDDLDELFIRALGLSIA